MTLYMKQKVFSWKDKFHIYDAFQEEKYYVEGEFFSLGKKLHLYDNYMTERSFIHQKVMSFLPRFFVNVGGTDVAEVVKKFTLFKPEYVVNGPGWTVSGDFWAHNYTITSCSGPVATISKRWLSWGDTYEIDIAPGQDEILVLSTVLIIDAVLAQQDAASASSHSHH